MTFSAEAPSNIALIKYMGKADPASNLPTNSSLSYTLNHLRTCVEIKEIEGDRDRWIPLRAKGYFELELSEKGQQRFLKYFNFLKSAWGIEGNFILASANNFPSDCGLASSASSFAALTRATFELACSRKEVPSAMKDLTQEDLADFSRQGSGSSCRSFFSPFSLWDGKGVRELALPIETLLHSVVVVESKVKEVSSSEAHLRVAKSRLFPGRIERAEKGLQDLLSALRHSDWKAAYQICWAEFWDMHALFESCEVPFGYMLPESLMVLRRLQQHWSHLGDGPLVTMDAGPNVHLLFREDQRELQFKINEELRLLDLLVYSTQEMSL
ncbi:MAG: diphosphomevalonate decarboxylase [Bdellovibrionales bacterium]|nr:diphosphomevalonate decarboxylase [Bdellovibrionales bacterium]